MSDSFATPWTVACQAPLSVGFPRQEYWNALPFPSPGDRPKPGTEPGSPALAGEFFTTEPLCAECDAGLSAVRSKPSLMPLGAEFITLWGWGGGPDPAGAQGRLPGGGDLEMGLERG